MDPASLASYHEVSMDTAYQCLCGCLVMRPTYPRVGTLKGNLGLQLFRAATQSERTIVPHSVD